LSSSGQIKRPQQNIFLCLAARSSKLPATPANPWAHAPLLLVCIHNPALNIISSMEIFPYSKERVVLSPSERRPGRRSVHEPDPHLPVVWRELLRLPGRAAASRAGTGRPPRGMDAVELSRDSGARRAVPRFGRVMMNPWTWPERILFGHAQGAV